MNCANHPETAAVAYCRECGKPLCEECRRPALGSIYCAEHAPGAEPAGAQSFLPPPPGYATPPPPPPPGESSSPYTASGSPYTASGYGPPPDHGPSPALAFGLGFIPGVGAIYNGQYAKGLIHAIVFGLLVSVANTVRGALEPLAGIGIAVWVFYMAFEAYHTARNRRYGKEVEEFSSLFDMNRTQSRVPGGPLILIALGVLLLLDTTDIINLEQLDRYWPVGLILLGLYLLYLRTRAPGVPNGNGSRSDARQEAGR
jgi:hypothetical protein